MKRKRYNDEQIAFALRQGESGTAVESRSAARWAVSEPDLSHMEEAVCREASAESWVPRAPVRSPSRAAIAVVINGALPGSLRHPVGGRDPQEGDDDDGDDSFGRGWFGPR